MEKIVKQYTLIGIFRFFQLKSQIDTFSSSTDVYSVMLKYFIEKNDRVTFQVHDFLFKRSSDNDDGSSDAETANLIAN